MYTYVNNPYSKMPYGGSSLNANQYPFNQPTQNSFVPIKLPFLTTLELPDLSKLMNDPIRHHFSWPPVPVKIPMDISKFDGMTEEYLVNHITTYHL